jgi:7-alpha-hydroxysteroid dehydrogenase
MTYDPKAFRLDGEVAVVTGAGAGIGKAIATTFAGAGAAVVVSDLDAKAAHAAAAEITSSGGRAVGLSVNVTEEKDLVALVDEAVAEFGKLTLLVNNAGAAARSRSTCR